MPDTCSDPHRRNPLSVRSARLDDPGKLIAALPAMLRFVPKRSLVLAVLAEVPDRPGSALLDLVVRFDLYGSCGTKPADSAAIAAAARLVCARPDACGVLAVVVDEAFDPHRPALRVYPALTAITQHLEPAGIRVRGVWAVPRIEAGQRWRGLVSPHDTGVVADPRSSLLTVGRVLDGQPILRDRTELTALVSPDPQLQNQLDHHLTDIADTVAESDHTQRTTQLRYVYDLITALQAGTPADPEALARTVITVRDNWVRDAVFALARTVYRHAAEDLFAQLTRATTDKDRAQAATLLAGLAYTNGDGPLAGIALTTALEADPHHSMAALLLTALETGMHPDRVAELVDTSQEIAAELRVTIPGKE